MDNVLISFGIVTYNNDTQIRRLILNIMSACKNLNNSYKIVVVDNGSRDSTLSILQALQNDNSHLIFTQTEHNIGFGAAHNKAASLVKSKFHFVVNPDIKIKDSNNLLKMIQFMESNTHIGLLSPLVYSLDGSFQRLYKREPTVLDLALRFISPKIMRKRQASFVKMDSGHNMIGPIEYATGAFMLFRSSVFKKVGGFDERYFMYMEDADITRSVNKVSQAVFFPNASVVHAWQRANHKSAKHIYFTINSMIKYFCKWGWKLW